MMMTMTMLQNDDDIGDDNHDNDKSLLYDDDGTNPSCDNVFLAAHGFKPAPACAKQLPMLSFDKRLPVLNSSLC